MIATNRLRTDRGQEANSVPIAMISIGRVAMVHRARTHRRHNGDMSWTNCVYSIACNREHNKKQPVEKLLTPNTPYTQTHTNAGSDPIMLGHFLHRL